MRISLEFVMNFDGISSGSCTLKKKKTHRTSKGYKSSVYVDFGGVQASPPKGVL